MFEFTTHGRRFTCTGNITEDAEAREARECKAVLRNLREVNDRERLHADSRLRLWRYRFQLANDVE
jgi:hypothetical protein